MNKYSEMSDYDINHIIAEVINNKEIPKGIGRDVFIPKICENYHDAFKLIIDNGISLINHNDKYDACYKFGDFKPIRSVNKNPCRAIAGCYLLIKDEERGNEKAQKEV